MWHNEDGRLRVMFDMDGLKSGEKDYKVGYSFGLQDSSFFIDFYTKEGERFYDQVSLNLLEKFRRFHNNLQALYSFSRKCFYCYRFNSNSNRISLNFRTQKIGDIELAYETFGFAIPAEENYKIIVLSNRHKETDPHDRSSYIDPRSMVHFWRGDEREARYDYKMPQNYETLILPPIPFVSVEETRQRLNSLLVFA